MQARFHSLHLALQIKARMEGLPTPVHGMQHSDAGSTS
jgi:putative flavoprotein involved in K+ transport